jgi:hypothetical protein
MPEEHFAEAWCNQCLNPDCSRSTHGKTRFDQRTLTWEERLFTQVPRMSPQDPRYLQITRQAFHTIDVGPTPEVRTSAWHDPRDLGAEPAPTHFVAPAPPPQAVVPAPVALPAAPVVTRPVMPRAPAAELKAQPVLPTPAPPAARPAQPAQPIVPLNTPAQKGRMLHGAPPPQPAPDPWGGPLKPAVPSAPGRDVIVTPGAKVRLGGGGT